MPRKTTTRSAFKKTMSVRVHQSVHAELEKFKQLYWLTSEEVITRGIQLVQKEIEEVGKREMISRFRKGLSKTIWGKVQNDKEERDIRTWEIENGRKY